MNTIMSTTDRIEPLNAAERMRHYRRRRRQGLQHIRIPLHVTEIDALIRIGLLTEERRQDDEALRAAFLELVYRALDVPA
jgi:hypothetical protein